MNRFGLLMVALLAAASSVAAGPLRYSLGSIQFEETSRAESSDLLALSLRGWTRSSPFDRSRGVGDVAKALGDGKLLFAGELMDMGTGVVRRPPRGGFWLTPVTTVNVSLKGVVVNSPARECQIPWPLGARAPKVDGKTTAWFAAGADRLALFLLEMAPGAGKDQAANGLLPFSVDIDTCKTSSGAVFPKPGFDHRLLSNGHLFWLSSNVEASLAWSTNGFNWTSVSLPRNTHTLLASHVSLDGKLWVAISRADQDFELGVYERAMSGGAWQAVDWHRDSEMPPDWLEGAREVAVQRAAEPAQR